jgi:hypothetical protein
LIRPLTAFPTAIDLFPGIIMNRFFKNERDYPGRGSIYRFLPHKIQ